MLEGVEPVVGDCAGARSVNETQASAKINKYSGRTQGCIASDQVRSAQMEVRMATRSDPNFECSMTRMGMSCLIGVAAGKTLPAQVQRSDG